jgi:hypothetical protein
MTNEEVSKEIARLLKAMPAADQKEMTKAVKEFREIKGGKEATPGQLNPTPIASPRKSGGSSRSRTPLDTHGPSYSGPKKPGRKR